MKRVAFIWAIYLLGLMFVPCTDGITASAYGESDPPSLAQKATDHNQDASHMADLCSPLCSCHCCHSHIDSIACAFSLDIVKIPITKISCEKTFTSLHIFSIWQPPQA